MKRFILLDHEPWTVNSLNNFYKMFQDAGIKLSVWNLTQLIHPEYHLSDEIDLPTGGREITNFAEFYSSLEEEYSINDIVIIECIPRCWITRKIFKEIGKRKIPTVRIECYGNTPTQTGYKNIINKIFSKQCKNLVTKKIRHWLYNLYSRIHQIPPQTVILSSNSHVNRTAPFNHPDYDRFRFGNLTSVINGKYIVFSDVYFPLHPDITYQYGINKSVDENEYYTQMKILFDKIEEKYNIPIVIAAHPKSNYNGSEFGQRQIIKGKTDKLIANCEGVIFHYSCTLSFVALCNKPVMFINSYYFEKIPFLRHTVRNLAMSLHVPYYTVKGDNIPEIAFTQISDDVRNGYIYSYLTSIETQNTSNSIILKNVLLKL